MSDLNVRDYNGVSIPAAGVYDIDPAHSRVGFVAKHLVVSKVRGQFKTVTGVVTIAEDPLESSVTADIDAASIDTNQATATVTSRAATSWTSRSTRTSRSAAPAWPRSAVTSSSCTAT